VSKAERIGKVGSIERELPNVHAEPHEYYGGQQVASRARTFSNVSFPLMNLDPRAHAQVGTAGFSRGRPLQMDGEAIGRNRRLSHDEISASAPRRFLIDVEETMRIVLEQEDTDAK
jgi:alpha,alpha-trehalase